MHTYDLKSPVLIPGANPQYVNIKDHPHDSGAEFVCISGLQRLGLLAPRESVPNEFRLYAKSEWFEGSKPVFIAYHPRGGTRWFGFSSEIDGQYQGFTVEMLKFLNQNLQLPPEIPNLERLVIKLYAGIEKVIPPPPVITLTSPLLTRNDKRETGHGCFAYTSDKRKFICQLGSQRIGLLKSGHNFPKKFRLQASSSPDGGGVPFTFVMSNDGKRCIGYRPNDFGISELTEPMLKYLAGTEFARGKTDNVTIYVKLIPVRTRSTKTKPTTKPTCNKPLNKKPRKQPRR